MRMSTRGRYGLRLMMALVDNHGRGPTLAEEIAKSQSISRKYIHLLMIGLKSAGLVRTVRGPSGGYELARAPSAITALDIVAALEGSLAPVECVGDPGCCARSLACAPRDVWCEVAAAINGVLSGLTLEHLALRERAKQRNSAVFQI
jgi:Rrf2 family cysteine metabolism transcriptional repressor